MSFPALQKTWIGGSISGATDFINKLISVSAGGHAFTTLFEIKQAMINFHTAPWTVIGSSNSLSAAMDGTDYWDNSGDLQYKNGASDPFAWIVLEQTGVSGSFQVCFALDITLASDSGRNDISVIFSAAGFGTANGGTNGSTTARPTATDEQSLDGTDWIGAEGGSSTDKLLSVIQSDDGECTRVIISDAAGSEPITIMGFEKPRLPDPSWTTPHVCYLMKQTSASGQNAADNDLWNFSEDLVVNVDLGTARVLQPYIQNTIEAITETQYGGEVFFFSGELWQEFGDIQNLGTLFDWYWNTKGSSGAEPEDSFPAAGDRTFVCLGDFSIGWLDDSATDVAFTFTQQSPQFLGAETAIVNGASTLVLDKPSGVRPGDLLIMFWGGFGGGSAEITAAPSGWSAVREASTSLGGTAYEQCFIKIADYDDNGESSYTFTLAGSSNPGLGALLAYRPAHASQVDADAGSVSGSGASHTAPNITTLTDDARVISAYFFNRTGTSTHAVLTPPSGMTERVDFNGDSISRADIGLAIYDEEKASAGSYTGKTLTSESSTDGYAMTVSLRALGT